MQPTVTPIPLGFVSAFLVTGKKRMLVDAGVSARRLRAGLRRLGVEPRALSLVLVTHGHLDHFGGLLELVPEIRCPIAVHAADAEALRTGRSLPGNPIGTMAKIMVRFSALAGLRPVPPLSPDLVIDGSLDLRPYGIEGTAEHTPGHTPGSLSVFLANGEVIAGDLLRGSFTSRGTPRWPFIAQDIGEMRRSIGRVLDQRPNRIWTSHGGPLSADAVRDFLRAST